MNEGPSAGHSTSHPQSGAETAFIKLFSAGVLGWLVGTVILFGLSWVVSSPVYVPAAIVWTISHSWAGFLFGGLVLLGYGLSARLPLGRAASAYALPAGLLAGIAWLCLLIYPDQTFREDLMTYLPLVLMFYGIALLWIRSRRGGADTFARAVIPATVGGFVILGFVTVPVFASDAFRYRNAFQLMISKAEMRDGKFVAEGTLEIRDPGRYEFTAPRYVWALAVEEAETELGVITWGAAGAPKAGAEGAFPLQIAWSKALRLGEGPEFDSYEDCIRVEVHDPDQAGKVIYSLDTPIPNP